MDICVSPSRLHGEVAAIPSKSDAHRLLICAALASSETKIYLSSSSEDIDATCRCLEALGAGISRGNGYIKVVPIKAVPQNPVLDCGESGSTLRFLLPVAAAICPRSSFTGRGRLPDRPLGELMKVMEAHGVSFSAARLPFTVSGQLNCGTYTIPGNISSQYITGLLLALSAIEGESEIRLSSEAESSAYIDITLHALSRFGITPGITERGWKIPDSKSYSSPKEIKADGDWSNAAFFLSAAALGHKLTLSGLDLSSPQGDKDILSVLSSFGANIKNEGNIISVLPASLHGCTVDARPIPDLLPILAVVAACSKGTTRFVNAARLRLKESDRLETTARMLINLGINAIEKEDELIVEGGTIIGGKVDGANDHRIVMAAAIAATVAKNDVTITTAQAVNKSYPAFFDVFRNSGGIAYGI